MNNPPNLSPQEVIQTDNQDAQASLQDPTQAEAFKEHIQQGKAFLDKATEKESSPKIEAFKKSLTEAEAFKAWLMGQTVSVCGTEFELNLMEQERPSSVTQYLMLMWKRQGKIVALKHHDLGSLGANDFFVTVQFDEPLPCFLDFANQHRDKLSEIPAFALVKTFNEDTLLAFVAAESANEGLPMCGTNQEPTQENLRFMLVGNGMTEPLTQYEFFMEEIGLENAFKDFQRNTMQFTEHDRKSAQEAQKN